MVVSIWKKVVMTYSRYHLNIHLDKHKTLINLGHNSSDHAKIQTGWPSKYKSRTLPLQQPTRFFDVKRQNNKMEQFLYFLHELQSVIRNKNMI
jgi:hypothetical protein